MHKSTGREEEEQFPNSELKLNNSLSRPIFFSNSSLYDLILNIELAILTDWALLLTCANGYFKPGPFMASSEL